MTVGCHRTRPCRCRGAAPAKGKVGLRQAVAALAVLPLSACTVDNGILAPVGDVAARQWSHLVQIFLWMLPVAVPVFVALPLIIWRYRLRGTGRYRPRWEFNGMMELLIWAVPVLVVTVLGWNLWHETDHMDPYRPLGTDPPLRIEAIAYDWKWLFIYPDTGIATADLLVLPEGRPVTVELTSATVLQAFSVPRIGGQIYAMPAMKTDFNLRASAAGEYEGLNMQYNGDHFARQSFRVRVMPTAEFESWTEAMREEPTRLDTASLDRLARRDTLEQPQLFGGVDGDPFGDTIQAMMAGGRATEAAHE